MSNEELEKHINSVSIILAGLCIGFIFLLILAFTISCIYKKNAEQERIAEEARIASVFKELDTYKNEHYGNEYKEILKDNNSYKDKLQQDIDNLPEIKALNDKIKEDEGYKAILCKLDKGYAAKEKEKAKKLQEEQAAKKKVIDKKNREQKIKNTNKNMQNVAGIFAITIFAGLGISIGVYKGRKIIRKMKEDRAAKKEALERFIRTCK